MTREWQQAVERGDCEAVHRLLDAGEDIDQRDKFGQTALIIAVYRSAPTDLFRLLVERGANLNPTTKGCLTALMLAVLWGRADVVRILVEAGADVHAKGGKYGNFKGKTALKLAEEAGYQDIVQLLTQVGAE